jgi:hypothetical protein
MVYLTMGKNRMGEKGSKSDKWEEDWNVDGCAVEVGLHFAVGSECKWTSRLKFFRNLLLPSTEKTDT